MIKLLKFLITGEWCSHKYEIYKEIDVYDIRGDKKIPHHTLLVSRCSKCGAIKKDTVG